MSLTVDQEDKLNKLVAEGKEDEATKLLRYYAKKEMIENGYVSDSTNGKDIWTANTQGA